MNLNFFRLYYNITLNLDFEILSLMNMFWSFKKNEFEFYVSEFFDFNLAYN